LRFIIHGQSFIYHQIRKMIGVILQIIHSDLKDDFLDNAFYTNTVLLWLAPPEGLLLNRVFFDGYNKKIDIPEKLVFTPEEEQLMSDFKEKVICPMIYQSEIQEKTFTLWLEKSKSNLIEEDDPKSEGEEEEG